MYTNLPCFRELYLGREASLVKCALLDGWEEANLWDFRRILGLVGKLMENLFYWLISLAKLWLEEERETGNNVLNSNSRAEVDADVRCNRQLGGIITHY